MEVAITVDDLPANGELPLGKSRMEIAKKMLAIFKKHHIENVYGLKNGKKVKETKNGFAIIREWLDAGHSLGNHTYSHIDLVNESSNDYIADIQKNEALLKKLSLNDYHYFRYPFVSEGNTQEKRDHVRKYLFNNGYKIAPVTVDFFEYEWNDPMLDA